MGRLNSDRIHSGGSSILTGDMVATDLKSGKTGYSNDPNTKITGSLVVLDTSTATAEARQITAGKTSFVNGVKVTGVRQMIYAGESSAGYLSYMIDNESMTIIDHGVAVISGNPRAFVIVSDGVWIGGDASGAVRKVSKFNLASTIATGAANFTSNVKCMLSDGTNLFSAGDDKIIEKRNLSTGAPVSYYATTDGDVMGLVNIGSYLYAFLATVNKIHKVTKSNMTKSAESAAYGGAANCLCTDGASLFGGGATVNKVYKWSASDLSKTAESADLGGAIEAIISDGTFVYVAVSTANKLFKLNCSDLTTVTSYDSYGGAPYAVALDNSYVYMGGATTNKVFQLLKSDLSKVAESAALGGSVVSIGVG